MGNARTVGAWLKAELTKLADRHPVIADVRGAGLYLGVELMERSSAGESTPAAALATRVLDGLRDRKVLIGAAGRYGNVLKIRPPLCFSQADAGELVAALADTLEHE